MLRSVLLLTIFCFFGVLPADVLSPPCDIPPKVNYFLNCYQEDEKASGLKLVTKNVYGRCRIETISLMFDHDGDPNMRQTREMIQDATKRFLYRINNEKELASYFRTFPLTPKNVVIRIRMNPKYCGFYYPPLGNIAYVTAVDGKILYDTLNSYTYEYDRLRSEPLTIRQGG